MRHWLRWSVLPVAAVALASCNSPSDVLQPSAISPSSPQATAGAENGVAQPPPAQVAAMLRKIRMQIAPLVGASVEAAAPLTARMNARARERGIVLAGSSDPAATHILKGYFSVLTEDGDTTVVYVWDIYDPEGNRLHRINGQQKAPTIGDGEGWAGVSPATMQAVADSTIEQFVAWIAGRSA